MICYLKNKTRESFYVRGRHNNVDCFYLAQNYFKVPRRTIRKNANFVSLFPQDLKNLNHIFEDPVGNDMTMEEFRKLCKAVREKQNGFAIIDLSCRKHNCKYRRVLHKKFNLKKTNIILSLQN